MFSFLKPPVQTIYEVQIGQSSMQQYSSEKSYKTGKKTVGNNVGSSTIR